jgi:hypothetical protein
MIPDEYDEFMETNTIVEFKSLRDGITTYDFSGIKLHS